MAAIAAVWIGWVGFIASDDSLYYQGASRWLEAPPFPGDNHWTTRFPLVLSFAGALALLGRGFAAFAATALLFYAALVAGVGAFARSLAGARAGWIAALIAATLPVVVSQATTVGVDLLEASLLLGGVLLLTRRAAGIRHAAMAGLCFGLAMLCRETTLLPLAALGPLLLIGRPVDRRLLLAAGLVALAVLGAEAVFQWTTTGEPFRRYDIAFHHDATIDRAANREGNLLLHPAVDPLLVLFINDDFGLLFWFALPAVLSGLSRPLAPQAKARFVVLGAMAGGSFVLVSLLTTKLVLNPRYFMLPALAATVLVALWVDRLSKRRRVIVLVTLVATNLLLLSVANAHPRWPVEALVAAGRAHPGEVVHGAADDVRRGRLPLQLGSGGKLSDAPPPPRSLVIMPEGRTAVRDMVLARYPSPPTRLGAFLDRLGLRPLVPEALRRRLFAPNAAMVLVRTG